MFFKMFTTKCLFLTLISVTLGAGLGVDLVKISLYYESLCPNCIEFFKDQLNPAYIKLNGTGMSLDLIPFGKATKSFINKKWTFTCQHGPKECFGNKIQACILAHDTICYDIKVQFTGCIMQSGDPSSLQKVQECAGKLNVDWPGIEECVEGEEGNRILAHYGDRTTSVTPKLQHVPYILFNGIYNEDLENQARQNLVKAVCSLFSRKPPACHSS